MVHCRQCFRRDGVEGGKWEVGDLSEGGNDQRRHGSTFGFDDLVPVDVVDKLQDEEDGDGLTGRRGNARLRLLARHAGGPAPGWW